MAEKINEFIKSCGIHVYYDKFYNDLQQIAASNNPKDAVIARRNVVETSTDILVFVSPSTVSFE